MVSFPLHLALEITTFITLGLISDSGAHDVRGHGTRVWRVARKSDLLRPVYVLKDVWVNPNGQVVIIPSLNRFK
jgi:hypothetical protein